MKRYDYLIVGSGLFGATFAYKAAQAGKRCLVIDKRNHLGGNIYCEDQEGIHVHKYGAHIFHTNNKEVWQFVNSLVEFNRYTNCPVANYHGELYNLPFNMNTFNRMWPDVHTPAEAMAKLEEQRKDAVEEINKRHREMGVPELKASPTGGGLEGALTLEEQALTLVGKDIFYKLIKEYTEKQWGRDCKELPAFIIKRLPVRMIFDNNYFNDRYQGIPVGGYNKLIDKLLRQSPPKSPQKGGVATRDEEVTELGGIDTLVGISVPLNAPRKGQHASGNRGAYRETANPIEYEILKNDAKQMRKTCTEAESIFWELVRGRENTLGAKFRRQHIIDGYIVDFVSLENNLVVELDGEYHFTTEQQIEDANRTRILNEYGFTVLRIKNQEVISDPEGVLKKVEMALALACHLPELGGIRGAFANPASPLLGGLRGAQLVYTGAIDEYFGYELGKLDWRTVSFKTRVEDTPNYQGNAVVNYTSHEQPYTRVIEHKHFEMFGQEVYDCPKTVVSEEYSTEYKPGMEPYYPVNDERNNALADQYRALAAKEEGVIFGGRLAQYKYYDMAPVIEEALKLFA